MVESGGEYGYAHAAGWVEWSVESGDAHSGYAFPFFSKFLFIAPTFREPKHLQSMLTTLSSQRPQHRHLHLHAPRQHRRRQLLHHPNHRRPGQIQSKLHASVQHPLPRQGRPDRLFRIRRFHRIHRYRHRDCFHRYGQRSEYRHKHRNG